MLKNVVPARAKDPIQNLPAKYRDRIFEKLRFIKVVFFSKKDMHYFPLSTVCKFKLKNRCILKNRMSRKIKVQMFKR